MVSAARLGFKPNQGVNKRVKNVKGGLVTSKNIKNGVKSKLGSNMKARLSGTKVGIVGKVGKGKGKFVLANSIDKKGKVLIRTQKPNVQKAKAQQKVKPVFTPKKLQQGQTQQAQQKKPLQRQQVQIKRNVQNQNNPGQKKFQPQKNIQKQQFQQQRPMQGQQKQFQQRPMQGQQKQFQQRPAQQKQFQQRPAQQKQFQQRSGQQMQQGNRRNIQGAIQNGAGQRVQEQRNENKLALDIINILLEEKKANQNRQNGQRRPQRPQQQQQNYYNPQPLIQQVPQPVYVQPPPVQQPVYVQAPKTVYVDENGYDVAARPRRVIQDQPVVYRKRPVQVIRRAAGAPRVVQRRMY